MEASDGLGTLSQWIASQSDASITWKEIEWLRARWPGKLIVKGVLDAEDARLAVGAAAWTRSSCRTTAAASSTARRRRSACCRRSSTPSTGRCEVLFDGGVQCGQDVLKALALGARGCLVGKAFLYGARRRRARPA